MKREEHREGHRGKGKRERDMESGVKKREREGSYI